MLTIAIIFGVVFLLISVAVAWAALKPTASTGNGASVMGSLIFFAIAALLSAFGGFVLLISLIIFVVSRL